LIADVRKHGVNRHGAVLDCHGGQSITRLRPGHLRPVAMRRMCLTNMAKLRRSMRVRSLMLPNCRPRRDTSIEHVGVYHRRAHIAMAKQLLDRAHILPALEQMRRERMTKRVAVTR
jgi:hypothetical protein